MTLLENDYLKITINKLGAELTSVIDQKSGYEFMWQADEEYWGRHAPVLFPIVGRLKENQYNYQGENYDMTQHGFARDSEFEVVQTTEDTAVFRLSSSEETMKKYPFEFDLYIAYVLENQQITTKYQVVNKSSVDEMYYAIGAHPAFNMSQTQDADGELEFDQISAQITPDAEVTYFPLTEEGLIADTKAEKQVLGTIELTHETFKNDALVYKLDENQTILLSDNLNGVQIEFETSNLPYLGIWSTYPARAGFVCIEPWAGIADTESFDGSYDEKMGINVLQPNQNRTHEYNITFTKE